MITAAYRLPQARGRIHARRARETATRILAQYGDHLDAHAAADLWESRGWSPLATVLGAETTTARDHVITVLRRLDPDQGDAFLRSRLERVASGQQPVRLPAAA